MDGKVLEIEDIKKILPQRYPFLMIDRVIEYSPEKVVAIKNVSANEPYFEGHFPDEKIMPGVLQIEAMAQTGIVLVYAIKSEKAFFNADIRRCNADNRGLPSQDNLRESALDSRESALKNKRLYFLGSVNKARFFQPVRPGDILTITVTPVKILSSVGIISGEIAVNTKKVAQAEIAFGIKENA